MNNASVTDLIKNWINMMCPITHHLVDENSERWHPSIPYYNVIESIEYAIAEKLKITAAEAKIMLLVKKKMEDLKERKVLKDEE